MAESSLLLPLPEAASILGIPRQTLWRLAKDKLIESVRVGQSWYLRRETVDKIAAEGVPSRTGSALEAAALESQTESKDQ